MPNSHKCAADDCSTLIARHLLMCRRDWYLVPSNKQRRVYRAYRNRSRNWGAYAAAVAEAKDAVRAARQAAGQTPGGDR